MPVSLPKIVILALFHIIMGLYTDIFSMRSCLYWWTTHVDIAVLSVEAQI